MNKGDRIVIVGNGVAGNTALEAIRRSNPSADVVMVSEEPHPEYSACVLPYYVSGDLDRKRVFLKSLGDYRGVKARLGEKVRSVDPARGRVLLEKGDIPYDHLIVAAGGGPIMPSIPGIRGTGIFPLKTLADADRLARLRPGKVAVIGSGLIGVEAAVAMKKGGHEVSLVSRRWVLPRILDEEVGRKAGGILKRNGVEVHTGEAVEEIVLKGREVKAVRTDKRTIPCDLVIMAIGIKPRVDVAGRSRMAIGPLGGIKVNGRMETNLPRVYCCGDCAETVDPATGKAVLQLRWFNARQMGRIAGLNCMGGENVYRGALAGVALDLFGTAVGSVGQSAIDLNGNEAAVIETDHGASYDRVLVSDNAVKGAQFVGRTEEGGIFFSLIRNGYSYKDLSRGCSQFPWYHKLEPYLEAKPLPPLPGEPMSQWQGMGRGSRVLKI